LSKTLTGELTAHWSQLSPITLGLHVHWPV